MYTHSTIYPPYLHHLSIPPIHHPFIHLSTLPPSQCTSTHQHTSHPSAYISIAQLYIHSLSIQPATHPLIHLQQFSFFQVNIYLSIHIHPPSTIHWHLKKYLWNSFCVLGTVQNIRVKGSEGIVLILMGPTQQQKRHTHRAPCEIAIALKGLQGTVRMYQLRLGD